MEPAKTDPALKNDVPNLGPGTRLSAEEIAKAVAHHNRHHPAGHDQAVAAKAGMGKKGKKGK